MATMLFAVSAITAFTPPSLLAHVQARTHGRAQLRLQAEPGYVRDVGPRIALLLRDLAAQGAPRSQIEAAFAEAIEEVYAPPPVVPSAATQPAGQPAPPPSAPSGALVQPTTASDAQRAFKALYAGTGRPPVTSYVQKFLNVIVEDRTCIYNFEYNEVYAVGFAALVDAFLGRACRTPEAAAAIRSCLCAALGFDEVRVYADARALLSSSAGMPEADLFATPAFRRMAASRVKYTYALGVGLVLLMRATGETRAVGDAGKYGAQYAAGGAADGAVDRWCDALGLEFAGRLSRDTVRPLSIDGIGRFSFTSASGLEEESLESIGVQGGF
jgi:hypothetical protein